MTIKTLMTAAALIVASSAAYAECSWGKTHQAMTCASGTAYDAATNSCKVVTG